MKYIVIILVIVVAYLIFSHFRTRSFLNIITEEQFRQGYRNAQLIVVREPQEFERGHILGARNIPMTQLKSRLVELRKDKPVYLYCQGISRSNRAANTLRKNGYEHIRSEEHTSELQSRGHLVCRLLLEKTKTT